MPSRLDQGLSSPGSAGHERRSKQPAGLQRSTSHKTETSRSATQSRHPMQKDATTLRQRIKNPFKWILDQIDERAMREA